MFPYGFWACFLNFLFSAATMARLVHEIQSSQRFLQGLIALPNFPDLRESQATRILGQIKKFQLSVEVAARVLDELDVTVWGDAVHARFLAAVADCTESKARAKQQNFCLLSEYMNQQWWDFLESRNKDMMKLEALCKHASKLGLRNPTEGSYGALLALSFYSSKSEMWLESEKYKLLETHKGRMKKILQQEPLPQMHLLALPADPAQMPQCLLNPAYPNGFVSGLPSLTTKEAIQNLISTYPLRKTNRANPAVPMSVASSSSTDTQVLTVAMNTLATVSSMMQQQQQQQQQRVSDDSLPGLRIFKTPQKTRDGAASAKPSPFHPQLALEDKKEGVDALPTAQSVQDSAMVKAEDAVLGKQLSPRSTIQALRTELDKQKGSTGSVQKRPATKKVKKPQKKKPALRRPAAAPQVARRPAAASSVVSDGQARREKLLRGIPSDILESYKDGCSTCRGRPYCTVSCWFKRGFTV